MIALVFDIDGTLADSAATDSRLYDEALKESFSLTQLEEGWRGYAHVTDNGLCRELYRRKFGQELPDDLLERTKEIFHRKLEAGLRAEGMGEITGARAFLAGLSRDPAYGLAVATGAWKRSAEIKLGMIGVLSMGLPLATSDGVDAREEITRNALRLLENKHGKAERAVYFGDGVWDLEASRNLGIGFIGIGRKIGLLKEAGAEIVFPDFGDPEAVLGAVEALR